MIIIRRRALCRLVIRRTAPPPPPDHFATCHLLSLLSLRSAQPGSAQPATNSSQQRRHFASQSSALARGSVSATLSPPFKTPACRSNARRLMKHARAAHTHPGAALYKPPKRVAGQAMLHPQRRCALDPRTHASREEQSILHCRISGYGQPIASQVS